MELSPTCLSAVVRMTIPDSANRGRSGSNTGRPGNKSPGTCELKHWMDTRICPRRRHLFDAASDGCFPIPDCFASYDSILLVSRVQKACPRPNVRETSSIRQSNGLLIRRFGVRFPGLPPISCAVRIGDLNQRNYLKGISNRITAHLRSHRRAARTPRNKKSVFCFLSRRMVGGA